MIGGKLRVNTEIIHTILCIDDVVNFMLATAVTTKLLNCCTRANLKLKVISVGILIYCSHSYFSYWSSLTFFFRLHLQGVLSFQVMQKQMKILVDWLVINRIIIIDTIYMDSHESTQSSSLSYHPSIYHDDKEKEDVTTTFFNEHWKPAATTNALVWPINFVYFGTWTTLWYL